MIQSLTIIGVTHITGGIKLKTGKYLETISTLIAPAERRTLTKTMACQIDRLSLNFLCFLRAGESIDIFPISKHGMLETQAALLSMSLFLIHRNNSTLM